MDTTNHCPNCEALAKEIEELRKAVAVKNEALRELLNALAATLRYVTGRNQIDEYLSAMEEAGVEDGFGVRGKAALSSTPSGMVCVSKEKLREIEWNSYEYGDFCPVCYRETSEGHADDCWLSALIGGDDEHTKSV